MTNWWLRRYPDPSRAKVKPGHRYDIPTLRRLIGTRSRVVQYVMTTNLSDKNSRVLEATALMPVLMKRTFVIKNMVLAN